MKNIVLVCLVALCMSAFPSVSRAQAPFGGLVVSEVPCTCTPAFTWQFFTPIYFSLTPTIGALAVPVAPFMFANWYSFPGSWLLGLYTPGAQACYVYVGISCVQLPVLGMVESFTGSSLVP